MAELPSGTVTFLFTDLEVSTRLWEHEPDAMRDALARHDLILRGVVAAHGGQVVKGRGDGVHAVFETAHDAIAAAVDGQLALVGESWSVSEPLRVRMGLHAGAAYARDGDYFGTVVNRAARLMAAAHGDQIVCSQATADLARETLPEDVTLADLGEHRLRDLSRAEHIFQIQHARLPSDFPTLHSLKHLAGKLPTFLTSFVGRHSELASVADAIAKSRVVTLIGTGGVGKTRIAVRVAADVVSRFPDGAWLCELASVADGRGAAGAVAACLEVDQRPGESVAPTLLAFLRDKQLLLLLDNCDHLIEEAGSLAETIVHECPHVVVLVTSREALSIDGERRCPIAPLAIPDERASPGDLAAAPAVQLFVDRAQAVRPDFALDTVNLPVVAELCRQLDGVPLAIELAAARVASLTVNEIVQRLDQRFRLLTGGRRTALARHQTLRGAVDWSYELLSEPDARMFNRLAIFAGGFTLNAAEAIVSGEGIEPDEVLERLSSLVARSMVAAEASADETRYRLHETMRQYASERLQATGEMEARRQRHAQYYVALAEASQTPSYPPDGGRRLRTVGQEFANLAVALDVGTPEAQSGKPSRYVFHIALESEWRAAEQSGTYRVSTRGARFEDIGFVGAAFEHQVAVVGAVLYSDALEPIVVLVIDTELLDVPVVAENLKGGDEAFPHIYGPLPTHAVVETLSARTTSDGRFVLRKPDGRPLALPDQSP